MNTAEMQCRGLGHRVHNPTMSLKTTLEENNRAELNGFVSQYRAARIMVKTGRGGSILSGPYNTPAVV